MNKPLFALLAAGVLAATPSAASAQISTGLSIAAGLSLPSGDLSEGVESGYNAAVGLNIGVPLLPVGLRIEGGYNAFEAKNNVDVTTNIVSGTVNGTFGLGLPYVIGGLGYYRAQSKGTVAGVRVDGSESAAGINGGVGFTFPLGLLSTFAEIRYHKMLGDKDKGADAAYIPITFGIKF